MKSISLIMQALVSDLYPYIGIFLDDISLINFVMTSKSIYVHTVDYRNDRIDSKKLSQKFNGVK